MNRWLTILALLSALVLAACSQQTAPEATLSTLAMFDLSTDENCAAAALYAAFEDADTLDKGATIVLNGDCIYTLTDAIFLRGDSDIIVKGNGATLDAAGQPLSVFFIYENVTLTLEQVTIRGGEIQGDFSRGGSITNFGTLTLIDSTVSGSSSESGGGIFNTGTLTLIDSTVSGNNARLSGGGIYNSGELTLENSTVSGNSAGNFGGGIINYSSTATLTLTNSTVSGNDAQTSGGGILNIGELTLENSIIANSTNEDCILDATPTTGTVIDNGYNLVEDGSCIDLTNDTNRSGDPLLGSLADNGGPTETHLPLKDSPLLDAIPNGTNGCGTTFTTDQRGVSRPQEAKCDIGSVEVEVPNEPPTADAGGPYSGIEGAEIALDGSASSDPDEDSLTYLWSVNTDLCSFDDATLENPTLTCADNGSFTVSLVVNDGTVDSTADAATVTVANVAPTIITFDVVPSELVLGQSVTASGSFSDVPADVLSASIDWGDGTSTAVSSPFEASHTYQSADSFTLTLSVSDDDDGVTSQTRTVAVLSAAEATDELIGQVEGLDLRKNTAKSLVSLLEAVQVSLERDDTAGALDKLTSFISQVEAQSGKKIETAEAEGLIGYAQLIITAIEL